MNSWFDSGEDTSALWAQEQEELRRQEELRQAAQVAVAEVPYAAPPLQGPLNPNAGGFRDPVYNPPNVQPGLGADFVGPLLDLYNTEIPVWTDFARDVAVPAVNAAADPLGIQSFIQSNTIGTDIGMGDIVVPQTVGDVALNVATGGGLTGFDDLLRTAPGVIDNVWRAGMPEPSLLPSYGAGIPPSNTWDESVLGPLPGQPDLGQGPAMIGGEAAPLQGPVFIGGAENQSILEELAQAEAIAADDAAMARGLWGIGSNYPSLPNAAPLADGSPGSRMGAPLAYDPRLAPNQSELDIIEQARQAGRERYAAEAADPMQTTRESMESARANVRALEGGGTPSSLPVPEAVAGPVVATPPPASASQRIDDLISEAQAPRGQATFPMTVDEAVAEAERIGFPLRRENLEVGSTLTKQQEYDALSAAIDLDNFKRSGGMERATQDFFGGGRGSPPGSTAAGPPPRGVDTPQSRGIWDRIMEAAYLPFGGDVGTALRQDITRTFNVFRAGETRQVGGYVARIGSSREEAARAIEELQNLPRTKELGVKINFADWQGGNLSNRETMSSSLTNSIPGIGALNRMNAGEVNARRALGVENFLQAHPKATLAEAQTYANYMERVTGRGAVPFEKVLSNLGPLFTSMRFALSVPERTPYLLPVQRLSDGSWQMFGPGWREAVQDHAGLAVTLGGTLLAAQQAGLNVDWDKGSIKVGNSTYNLTGGLSGYWNTIQKMAEGDLMAGAEFVRNKIGPLPQGVIQGVKATGLDSATGTEDFFKFMRPEWWDRGATGSGEDWDRGLAFGAFLWMQDVAKAVRFADGNLSDKVKAGALAAPAAVVGISVGSYQGNPRTAANNAVLDKPENLEGLPPNVAEFLQGKSWNAATPQEQRVILSNISPEERAAIEKGEQVLRDRKDIFQLNRDEAKARYELAAENRAKLQPVADKVLADWKSGAMDPMKAIDAMKRIEAAADKEARFTSNVGPKLSESKAYQDAVKGFDGEKTPEQKEVDRIREIEQKYYGIYEDPRVNKPDGTKDWDKIEAAQKAILDTLRKSDPGFATRVEFNLQKDPASDFEMTKWIAKIDDRLEKAGYFDQPTGKKTEFARQNPEVDALLSFKNGWPVHSQQAKEILQRLAPERKPVLAR